MTTPKNLIYQNSDTASIYNAKQNANTFLTDLADLDFINIIKDPEFNNQNLEGTLTLSAFWTTNGILGELYDPTLKQTTVNLDQAGYIRQTIHADLKTNTNYSLIFYGSSSVSGALKVSVNTTNNYQIYNVTDETEINSASVILGESVSGVIQKHFINFRTTAASAVQPNIYFDITNISNAPVSGVFRKAIVYSSLIEVGDVPNFRVNMTVSGGATVDEILPDQANITAGVPYYNSIYSVKGVAVSGSTTNPLPVQANITAGTTYKRVIFNSVGVAVSGSNTSDIQTNITPGVKYYDVILNDQGIAVSGSTTQEQLITDTSIIGDRWNIYNYATSGSEEIVTEPDLQLHVDSTTPHPNLRMAGNDLYLYQLLGGL